MKTKLLLAICCGITALTGTAYALAAHESKKEIRPAGAAIGPWRALDAAGVGTHAKAAARKAGAGDGTQVALAEAADGAYVGVLRDVTAGLRVSAIADDPSNHVVLVHELHPLSGMPLINDSLDVLTLTETPAADGTVGRIFGAGVIRGNAKAARLVTLDGSVEQLPLVDLGGGFRAFAFVAEDATRFPTTIEGLDAAGQTVAEFQFDPTSHP